MSVYVNTHYRIKRSMDQQDMMQKLTANNRIFESYRDILVLSAVIGYLNKKFIPIKSPASDGVLMQFFTENDYDLMDMIAFAHTKDQFVIKSDEKYEVFASYANGGFPILIEKLGIDNTTEIDPVIQRSLVTKLYAALLSKSFIKTIKDDEGELFI